MEATENITPEEEKIIHAVVDAIGHNPVAYDKLVKSYGEKVHDSHGDKTLQVFSLVQKHPDFEQRFNDLVAKPVMHKLQQHAPSHNFIQFFLWLAKVAGKVIKAIVQVAKIIKKAVDQHKAKKAAAAQQAAQAKAAAAKKEQADKYNNLKAGAAIAATLLAMIAAYFIFKKKPVATT